MKWFSLFIFCLPLFASSAFAYDFIQVTGEGEIQAKPDFILINASVFSRASTAKSAQKMNSKEMARVEKILKQDFKIDSKDIQTSSFQVQPQYEYAKDKPVYRGMAVTHHLRVKFRKVDEVGGLLDRLIESDSKENFGVRIDDISFGTDQMKSYQVQALENAVAQAKIRAQALAKASGKSLVSIRKIMDSKVSLVPGAPGRSFGKMVAMDEAGAGAALSPGEIEITADVQVEFEIK